MVLTGRSQVVLAGLWVVIARCEWYCLTVRGDLSIFERW